MPLGTSSLRDLSAILGSARLGRRGISPGSRPRGLALTRDLWPAPRTRKVENIDSVSWGTPSHSAEPCRQRQNPLFAPVIFFQGSAGPIHFPNQNSKALSINTPQEYGHTRVHDARATLIHALIMLLRGTQGGHWYMVHVGVPAKLDASARAHASLSSVFLFLSFSDTRYEQKPSIFF